MTSRLAIRAERAFVDGKIRSALLGQPGEAAIHLDDSYLVLPGLINAHDHLQFNSFPLLGRQGAYGDSYQWAAEIEGQRDAPEIQAALAIPLEDRLRIGGLKNLLSGVTTVAHHDPYNSCFEGQFPVRVVRNYSWSHSLSLDTKALETFRGTPPETPWMIHAAEGITERAAQEMQELERLGLLAANTVLVHALAASPAQMLTVRGKGASIIACPVSNQFLYGRTLDFSALPAGLRLALGSDSAATSSSGILEDLQALRSLVDWPEEKLWTIVTTAPANILRLPSGLSDLVALRDGEPALVVIDGDVRLSGEEFRHLFDEEPRRIRIRGHVDFLSKRIRVPWKSVERAAEWTPYLRRWLSATG
jgi:cytosine/adenosine deaminase-related metal-dependent hydrolase